MSHILIVGASGPTGREATRQAVARGHDVRVLSRRPTPSTESPGSAVEVVRGDVLDPMSLRPAVAGRDAVVCILGTKLSLRPTTVLSEGTRNLVDAMRGEGVWRLICVTGVGAGDSRGHGPWYYDRIVLPLLLRAIYDDKDRQERVVRESGLDWVIVRPGMLRDGPARNSYRVAVDLDGVRAGSIRRSDVAAFLLDQIGSDRYLGRAPLISD